MTIEITTPDKKLFSGEVKLIQLPGIDGSFEILNNHAPLISAIGKGKIKIIDNNSDTIFFEIKNGIVEVLKNKVTVLVE
jgi:F-type H+-transporting ATPase subunit epsilon